MCIRDRYGIVGNAPETYTANIVYEQGSDNGFTWNTIPSSWGNADIRPEKKYEYEIGLESKFLNNRLGIDVSLSLIHISQYCIQYRFSSRIGL